MGRSRKQNNDPEPINPGKASNTNEPLVLGCGCSGLESEASYPSLAEPSQTKADHSAVGCYELHIE